MSSENTRLQSTAAPDDQKQQQQQPPPISELAAVPSPTQVFLNTTNPAIDTIPQEPQSQAPPPVNQSTSMSTFPDQQTLAASQTQGQGAIQNPGQFPSATSQEPAGSVPPIQTTGLPLQNNLAPPGQQQWYPPPASPTGQYQNYSPSTPQPPQSFPQTQQGYGQYPPPQGYPQQPQQQQNYYPQQQQWPQQQVPYGYHTSGAYNGYPQPPSPQIPPQQGGYPQPPSPQVLPQQGGYPQPPPSPYAPPQQPGYPQQVQPAPGTYTYPQHAQTVPNVGSGPFPTSSNPYIPPTVGYNLATIETAPAHIYPPEICNVDVDLIVKAFSSVNTDEKVLISTLSKHSHPLEIASRKYAYRQKYPGATGNTKELIDIINSKELNFSGGFKSLTHALVAGPLELDVSLVREAIKGAGTNERMLNLVLLCRNNEDIKSIAQYYQGNSSKTLLQALEGDLSGDILSLFQAVMRAERQWDNPAIPIPKPELEANVRELQAALTGNITLNTVIKYFVYGSYHRLASINKEWKTVTSNKESLEKRIEKKFRGHMEDALLYILTAATDRALCHAKNLDKTLSRLSIGGVLSNKQEEIAVQVAKIVWEDQLRVGSGKPSGGTYIRGDYLSEVSERYRDEVLTSKERAMKKDLIGKLSKETSGDFKNFLVALWSQR